MTRLASVPRIHCVLVEADLDAVLGLIRGEATAALNSYEADRWRRVSRLRCNPRFVLYEEYLDHVTMQMEMNLQYWTGGRAYLIYSQTAPYPLDPDHARKLHLPDAPGSHGFVALDSDRMRRVFYQTEARPRYFAKGAPWDIEDSYVGLKPRERITRDRLCIYMERLGIDPEATFERRELDDPVLFTQDHSGNPASGYPEEAARYDAMIERGWIGNIIDGRWF